MSSIDVLSGLRIKKRWLCMFFVGGYGGVGGKLGGCFEVEQSRQERGAGLMGWMFWVNNRLAVVAPRARGAVEGERMVCFALGRRVVVSLSMSWVGRRVASALFVFWLGSDGLSLIGCFLGPFLRRAREGERGPKKDNTEGKSRANVNTRPKGGLIVLIGKSTYYHPTHSCFV